MTHDTTVTEFPRNAVAMWSSGLPTLLAVTDYYFSHKKEQAFELPVVGLPTKKKT